MDRDTVDSKQWIVNKWMMDKDNLTHRRGWRTKEEIVGKLAGAGLGGQGGGGHWGPPPSCPSPVIIPH